MSDKKNEKIAAFLKGRTIGINDWDGSWHWRGQGYDEGWEDLTEDEVAELHRLMRGEE